MLLLSRVAEHLYWAARYVERAEVTARVVSEHTHLLVDLPTSVPLTWEPLLDLPGVPREERGRSEREVVAFLLADPANPSSVLASVVTARANLRATREVLPREAWEVVNSLYLFVSSHHEEGVDRWSRGRFLDRVIAEAQRFHGVLAGTMARGPALGFLRLGRSLERADMTGRVLDARAVPLLAAPAGSHAEVQWSAVLRSLSALPAYHQRGLAPVAGRPAVDLLLHDPDLPSSIACCLTEVSAALAELPRSEAPAAAATAARRALAATTPWPAPALHDGLGRLRSAIAAVHDEVQATWFPPLPPAPPAPPDDASPSPAPSPSPPPAPSTAPPGTPAPTPPGSSPGAPTAAGTRAD